MGLKSETQKRAWTACAGAFLCHGRLGFWNGAHRAGAMEWRVCIAAESGCLGKFTYRLGEAGTPRCIDTT